MVTHMLEFWKRQCCVDLSHCVISPDLHTVFFSELLNLKGRV